MKILLTIKTTYLPSWRAYEGIRELIQNARDADRDGHTMTVDWYNDTLRIENTGTTLPTKALLLGHTTKDGRSDQIGKFGEGLKLGVLALVRDGHEVKIRNGAEVWMPSIERSEVFDADVLAFTIEGGRKSSNRVRIEIGGVTKEAWEMMKPCFLFLQKGVPEGAISTSYGTFLKGDTYRGRIYVKGIFVQTVPDMRFGYDLTDDVELDRDRKMVESWNLRYRTKQILLEAVSKDPTLRSSFVEMLEAPTPETEQLTDGFAVHSLSNEAAQFVAAEFKTKHGDNAVPVATLADSADMAHLGKRGVVVPKQLGAVLAKTLGDSLKVREALQKEVLVTFSWDDLSEEERSSLLDNIALVNRVEPISLNEIDIVEFRTDMFGQFKGGRVLLAKKYLTDRDETLATLIHEVSHRQGGDGEFAHVSRMEAIWKGVVALLRKGA